MREHERHARDVLGQRHRWAIETVKRQDHSCADVLGRLEEHETREPRVHSLCLSQQHFEGLRGLQTERPGPACRIERVSSENRTMATDPEHMTGVAGRFVTEADLKVAEERRKAG